MSSDALTYALNNNTAKKLVSFRDFYLKRWEDEVYSSCKIKCNNVCRLTEEECNYDDCYRRSLNHVNY
jgi:hypothetical protein